MTYRFVNRACLAVGLVTFAVIVLMHVFCDMQCGLVALTGKPCVMCGCTRDFFSMVHGNFDFINPYSPLYFAVLILELGLRTACSFVRNAPRWFIMTDIVVHAALLVALEAANFVVIFG